jgi:hypothetical protein
MIKYEEHTLGPNHIMHCEYYPDKLAADLRQAQLRAALSRPIFVQHKKSLKTSEGVYKETWFVYYYTKGNK